MRDRNGAEGKSGCGWGGRERAWATPSRWTFCKEGFRHQFHWLTRPTPLLALPFLFFFSNQDKLGRG